MLQNLIPRARRILPPLLPVRPHAQAPGARGERRPHPARGLSPIYCSRAARDVRLAPRDLCPRVVAPREDHAAL